MNTNDRIKLIIVPKDIDPCSINPLRIDIIKQLDDINLPQHYLQHIAISTHDLFSNKFNSILYMFIYGIENDIYRIVFINSLIQQLVCKFKQGQVSYIVSYKSIKVITPKRKFKIYLKSYKNISECIDDRINDSFKFLITNVNGKCSYVSDEKHRKCLKNSYIELTKFKYCDIALYLHCHIRVILNLPIDKIKYLPNQQNLCEIKFGKHSLHAKVLLIDQNKYDNVRVVQLVENDYKKYLNHKNQNYMDIISHVFKGMLSCVPTHELLLRNINIYTAQMIVYYIMTNKLNTEIEAQQLFKTACEGMKIECINMFKERIMGFLKREDMNCLDGFSDEIISEVLETYYLGNKMDTAVYENALCKYFDNIFIEPCEDVMREIEITIVKTDLLVDEQQKFDVSSEKTEDIECCICCETAETHELYKFPCHHDYYICKVCWFNSIQNMILKCPICRRKYKIIQTEYFSKYKDACRLQNLSDNLKLAGMIEQEEKTYIDETEDVDVPMLDDELMFDEDIDEPIHDVNDEIIADDDEPMIEDEDVDEPMTDEEEEQEPIRLRVRGRGRVNGNLMGMRVRGRGRGRGHRI